MAKLEKTKSGCCSDPDCDQPKPEPKVSSPKVGRNDPCICGNGKKYKRCCGEPS